MQGSPQPRTQTMKSSDARRHWSQLLDQVRRREQRVVVEKDGIPAAAIISADDLEQLQRFEQQRAERFKALEQFAEPFKNERPEDIEREVAKAVKAARAELGEEARRATQRS
jgi:prevent-host-death family protein